MNNTKLIRHLIRFDKNEMRQFGYFLESPYFFKGRKDEKLIDFFAYLKKFYPDFSHKKLNKEAAYAALYPDRPFNEQMLQQLMTKLYKAVEHFIEIEYRRKTFGYPPEGMGQAAFYENKKMFSYFEKSHQAVNKFLSTQLAKGPVHLWFNFLQAKQLTDHQGNFNLRHTDLNLPETLLSLDYFYLVIKLEFACAFQNQNIHQLPIDSQGGLAVFDAVLPLLKAGKYREEPLVDLLYRTYLLLQEGATIEEFEDLKMLFEKDAMKLALSQRQIVHGALRNYCSRQINAGNESYLQELMTLYQEGLPLDVLYIGGKLSSSTFQNMVTVGLKLQNFDWVESFLEEHRERIISKEEPESFYTLARASLLFKQKKFEESLEYLTYGFTDTYSKLIARRLEIQNYYELESSILDSKIQAFKVFVFRTSKSLLTKVQKDAYSNFIDVLKQILHPSTLHNPKRINAIREKLVFKKIVSEKKWLLRKIAELDKAKV